MWKISTSEFIHNSHPLIMAHRGDSASIPENTLQAFSDAAALEVDVLETDVHITKDKELVLFHDTKLDRTTNGIGKIFDFTLQELQQLDAGYWFDPEKTKKYPFRGKGLRILTLRELLTKFPKLRFNLDIKDKVEEQPKVLADLLEELQATNRVQVGSFHQKQINKFRSFSSATTSAGPIETLKFWRKSRKWRLNSGDAEIENRQSFTNDQFGRRQQDLFGYELEYQSLTVPIGFPLGSTSPFLKLVTADSIAFAHFLGIAVHVWTINDIDTMKYLLQIGVDGIFTDDPKLLIALLKNQM